MTPRSADASASEPSRSPTSRTSKRAAHTSRCPQSLRCFGCAVACECLEDLSDNEIGTDGLDKLFQVPASNVDRVPLSTTQEGIQGA